MQHKPCEGDKSQYRGQADKKVSRRASEKGRLEGLLCIRDLQHVAHAPDCLDQLCPVIVVYFSAESLYCDIDRISVAVKIHVPDLRGNQGAGRTSP